MHTIDHDRHPARRGSHAGGPRHRERDTHAGDGCGRHETHHEGHAGHRELRLASYNIRKAVGLDWRRDAVRTLQVINELDADVVVLQEADVRLGRRPTALPRALVESETDLVVADVAPNEVSLGWHGNAILVRRGLEVERTERIDLPSLEPRGAVAVDVSVGGESATIVGVHLALLRRWRRRQLQTLRKHLGQDRIARTVIAGDFNEWSSHAGLEALSGAFEVLSPGKTFHASLPRAGLDRIAHGERFESTAAGVHESPRALVSSDHLPIWSDLRLRVG